MATPLDFYIVDVFSSEQVRNSGNQLAVFDCSQNPIADAEMQAIAGEINFSETTFILPHAAEDEAIPVRIFTPRSELAFAGHPTLGTSYVAKNILQLAQKENIQLSLKAGIFQIQVDAQGLFWVQQLRPTFGEALDTKLVAKSLSIPEDYINHKFPVQETSTGLSHIIVPLNSLEAIKSAHIERETYYKLISRMQAKSILVFTPETYLTESDFNARVFIEYYGLPEDAATGSGAGCLGAYLAKHNFEQVARTTPIILEQGYEMGRPSQLFVQTDKKGNDIIVSVGGKVKLIAEGKWYV